MQENKSTKKIVFVDTSASLCNQQTWNAVKELLKATLRTSQNLDVYVCTFADEVKLLNKKELQRLISASSLQQVQLSLTMGTGTSIQHVENFFPSAFLCGAKVEIISDMLFGTEDAEEQLTNYFNSAGATVVLLKVDDEIIQTIGKAKRNTFEKPLDFKPTMKAKSQGK